MGKILCWFGLHKWRVEDYSFKSHRKCMRCPARS